MTTKPKETKKDNIVTFDTLHNFQEEVMLQYRYYLWHKGYRKTILMTVLLSL